MFRSPIRDARPSGTVASEYDVPTPVTTYAASTRQTGIAAHLNVPACSNRTNSAVVSRRPRRVGLDFHYSHGGVVQPFPEVPTPGAGGVRSSTFQPILVQLHDWCVNRACFAAGYPRNLGLSTRVSQLQTNRSGGSTDAEMDQRPLFPKVQRVPRYSVRPAVYQTRSSRG
jgi:hypothetical protein